MIWPIQAMALSLTSWSRSAARSLASVQWYRSPVYGVKSKQEAKSVKKISIMYILKSYVLLYIVHTKVYNNTLVNGQQSFLLENKVKISNAAYQEAWWPLQSVVRRAVPLQWFYRRDRLHKSQLGEGVHQCVDGTLLHCDAPVGSVRMPGCQSSCYCCYFCLWKQAMKVILAKRYLHNLTTYIQIFTSNMRTWGSLEETLNLPKRELNSRNKCRNVVGEGPRVYLNKFC